MKDEKTVAVVPGSFDPITYGHLDIVKRAAELYDEVYLAVMINDQKKYLFSIEERELIANVAVKTLDLKNVTVISSTGMLWKLAEELCADAIVKGYRNSVDYEYELKMAKYNEEHNPNAKTVLLEAKEDLSSVSSTNVRTAIADNTAFDGYLPPTVAKKIQEILLLRKN